MSAASIIPVAPRARTLLTQHRERAERNLNAIRCVVLLLLAGAALAYAPSLPHRLNATNAAVLLPLLAWALGQQVELARSPRVPRWLAVVNPLVDATAVTTVLLGYALGHSAALALRSPMLLAYFIVLAARPVASSSRTTALVAAVVVLEYAGLLALLYARGDLPVVASPLVASGTARLAPLDEGARVLLLAVAGMIATYATAWHERLAIAYDAQARERAAMEGRLAEARFEALRLQLRPHFLFNVLNTITALIGVDARAAERMVSGLSDLLRESLRAGAAREVTLARELELLRPYLEIQKVRFHDRLRVELAIAADVSTALVPHLVLQPLVENAIQHGIAPRAAGGHVQIRARRRCGMLHLRVSDDGVGPRTSGAGATAEGVGLGNTRARLRHLYGGAHRLVWRRGVPGGFVVSLAIPYREVRRPSMAEERFE